MDLKKDLDEYLLLQSDQKKSFKLTVPQIRSPNTWFTKTNQSEANESWFQETKRTGCCPTMSRMQKIVSFGFCLCMGILCFSLSAIYIPVLIFKARKFSLLFTLGSMFIILSLAFLWGPMSYAKHMFSKERLLLTSLYVGSLLGTLYCALHLQSTPLTVLLAVVQIISLFWNVVSYIPGGGSGISFFGRIFSRSVSQTLPI